MSLASQISPQRSVVAARWAGERGTTADRRAALFRESRWETCQRVALGLVWVLRPKRIAKLLPLGRVWLADCVNPRQGLPDPDAGNDDLAGMVRDFSTPALVAAYERGLYPRTHFGPLKWMSPARRCVLFFDDYHISKRVRAIMRQGRYRVTFDQDFEGVIKACAEPRAKRWPLTWITPRVMRAYAALHDAGHAHSFEVLNASGELVGGGYGVVVGGVFVIESQFARESNTSKIGFSVLNWHLAKWGFLLSDNKLATPVTVQMGFREVPRSEYLRLLAGTLTGKGKSGRWEVEAGPKMVADWRPGNGSATAK